MEPVVLRAGPRPRWYADADDSRHTYGIWRLADGLDVSRLEPIGDPEPDGSQWVRFFLRDVPLAVDLLLSPDDRLDPEKRLVLRLHVDGPFYRNGNVFVQAVCPKRMAS
jgi:hypothetical protein